MEKDQERIQLIHEAMGYCFIRSTDEQVFFALLGSGGAASNGSPILGATAESAIPVRSTPFEVLLDVGTTRLFPADEMAPTTFLGRTERARATALSAELDTTESESLAVALGAGGTGKGVAASIRGSARS